MFLLECIVVHGLSSAHNDISQLRQSVSGCNELFMKTKLFAVTDFLVIKEA